MTEALYTLRPGRTPLLINVPHAGTYIPAPLRAAMTPIAQTTPDTDWHVGLLYEFALELGAGLMVATHSRYVVDLNRDPQNVALYPGADNTELCPTQSFDRDAIYLDGRIPDPSQTRSRYENYWAPYHAELRRQLDIVQARHGYAILLDGHSIRAEVPRFFAGRLPDLNLGTADGLSCSDDISRIAMSVVDAQPAFTKVLNGRFKGGYITRHYGQPHQQFHALQLEMAQSAYMLEAAPYAWDSGRARMLIDLLRALIKALLAV